MVARGERAQRAEPLEASHHKPQSPGGATESSRFESVAPLGNAVKDFFAWKSKCFE